MKRKEYLAYIAVVLALMAGAAMPQTRKTQGEKPKSASSPAGQSASPASATGSSAVTSSGMAGQLAKFAGDGSVLVNSTVTETKLGNVGIGITNPGSRLSVQGMVESMFGGYKFPDGTIQTTAGISAADALTQITHDRTIAGNGTPADPLSVAVPLHLSGVSAEAPVLTTLAFDGGTGANFVGGGGGGVGAAVVGGGASGAGHTGGTGLTAFSGVGQNGAKDGLAGEFFGDVKVTGNLSKGGGSFKIDHPLDPENKYLYHSFVESPDMKNIYDGTVTTDGNGDATVTLPDWFEALNQDFRYQLTAIGTFAQAIVAQEIKVNSFTIKTNAPNVKVCWQVTGTRHDAYANRHRIPVEEQKPEDERGLYLHPDAFNKSEDRGVQFVKITPYIDRMNAAREQTRPQSQQQ
jgi:hypothetical protein